MSDFIAYAAGQSEPFDADCVITNKGVPNLFVSLELNMYASDSDEVESFTHNIGIMNSDENHSYKFLAVPEKWKNCEELEAVFYTDNGIIRMKSSDSDRKETDDDNVLPSGGSSGGCDLGFSVLGLGIIMIFKFKTAKN